LSRAILLDHHLPSRRRERTYTH